MASSPSVGLGDFAIRVDYATRYFVKSTNIFVGCHRRWVSDWTGYLYERIDPTERSGPGDVGSVPRPSSQATPAPWPGSTPPAPQANSALLLFCGNAPAADCCHGSNVRGPKS